MKIVRAREDFSHSEKVQSAEKSDWLIVFEKILSNLIGVGGGPRVGARPKEYSEEETFQSDTEPFPNDTGPFPNRGQKSN